MAPLLRFRWYLAVFIGLVVAVSVIRADDAAAPAPPVAPPPISTNTALPEPPVLSLRPKSTPETPPPMLVPPAPEIAPEPSHISNTANSPEDLSQHLLVVYNQNDPDSKSLASYYAEKREIPDERVLSISCSTGEEISREEYEETIRRPITSYLLGKNWMTRQKSQTNVGGRDIQLLVASRNEIWAIVLMRGVPLKVAPDPNDERTMVEVVGFQSNAAAVDSELALLPIFGLPKGGFVGNVFYDGKMTGTARVGPDLAKSIILVTRLDGPTPDDVRRMIDDSLYAEKNRLAGLAVIDTRNLTDPKNDYTSGDDWLRNARDMLVHDGWAVKFDDKPDVLPDTDPCDGVAIYLGWYAGGATGPWITPPNRFVRGAIAYHLHSFSAATVRNPTSNWVGPLIAHGAAATMGTVYEPILGLTPHEDIFTKRMLDGNYFAEAAYASQPGLSWMVTVVGDPLYRPFRQPLDSAIAGAGDSRTDHDDWLLQQQVRRKLLGGQLEAKTDVLERELEVPGAGPVAYEQLGDLLEKLKDPLALDAAEKAYQKAADGGTAPVDRIRLGLKLAEFYRGQGQTPRAKVQLELLRQLYPDEAKRFLPESPGASTTVSPLRQTSNPLALPMPPKPPMPPSP